MSRLTRALILGGLLLASCADAPPEQSTDTPDPTACARDDQCPAGHRCLAGTCRPAPCDDANVCPAGTMCTDGVCQPEPAECTRDDECPDGRCVEGRCYANQCTDGEQRPCRVQCLEGVERCNGGAWRSCSAQVTENEICGDGLDNNCDGMTDDQDPVCGNCRDGDERPCRTECGSGVERCFGNQWRGCTAQRRRPEQCGNEVDDDCDGEIDEECAGCRDGDARPCSTPCGDGVEQCVDGRWRNCSAPEPSDEVCDGKDNDCDGTTDEEILRACDNACGPGVEHCKDGAWTGCTAPENCPCAGDAPDEQVCGVCGVRSRTCEGERWGEWAECRERENVCRPGEAETAACDRCGTRRRLCTADCEWGDWQECRDQGACEPGETETEDCPGACGGTRTRTCGEDCRWGEWSACGGGPGESCSAGEVEERPCGDRCGVQRRVCGNDCRWGTWSECAERGECRPGDEEAEPCGGACSVRVRICDDQCRWGEFGECRGEGQCEPGAEEERACGLCGTQSRRCTAECVWSPWTDCAGEGVCTPGDRDERPCGSSVGACEPGVEIRTCDQTCEWTGFGECLGGQRPVAEICGDGIDQDCDGADRRDPDPWEPNNDCGRCSLIHDQPDPNVFLDATIDSVADRADFYCFDAEDGVSIPGFTESIVITLEQIPNGADFDLYLYANEEACRGNEPLAFSNNNGSEDEQINWGERLNHDDGGRYIVEVRRFVGHSCSRSYRLTVNGLR